MVGWQSSKKIVVFESDDWGSVRMSSSTDYNDLLKANVPVDSSIFTKFDSLEQVADLEGLFDILSSVKDTLGNPAKFTANAVVANPFFEKIEASGFSEYHYETIPQTYICYPDGLRVLEMWKEEGIASGLLYPQYHGREHINIKRWLDVLNGKDQREKLGFEKRAILGILNKSIVGASYMAAFDYNDDSEKADLEFIAQDGLKIFHEIFGFPSLSFVAPQSVRGDHLDKTLAENGVMFHQCGQQFAPNGKRVKTINRKWGDKNNYGMRYWRRNVNFEPAKDSNKDLVDIAMKEIKIAFQWNKPAVISTHRVNYIGSLVASNRDKSLSELKRLLFEIKKEYPDVEFMTSAELGQVILDSNG